MSMYTQVVRLTPDEVAFLVAYDASAAGDGEADSIAEHWDPEDATKTFQCEQDWHALHFLLTGSELPQRGSLGFLMDSDVGVETAYPFTYGGRIMSPLELRQIVASMQNVSNEQLAARCRALFAGGLNVHHWSDALDVDERDEAEAYLRELLVELAKFLEAAAAANVTCLVECS